MRKIVVIVFLVIQFSCNSSDRENNNLSTENFNSDSKIEENDIDLSKEGIILFYNDLLKLLELKNPKETVKGIENGMNDFLMGTLSYVNKSKNIQIQLKYYNDNSEYEYYNYILGPHIRFLSNDELKRNGFNEVKIQDTNNLPDINKVAKIIINNLKIPKDGAEVDYRFKKVINKDVIIFILEPFNSYTLTTNSFYPIAIYSNGEIKFTNKFYNKNDPNVFYHYFEDVDDSNLDYDAY